MEEIAQVLLIDDQPDFLEPMSFWMKGKGFGVTTAMDGAAGVDLVRKAKFDVIFVDYKMPNMDGVETIKKIREFNATIPIIILTAYTDDVKLQTRARELNISGLFPKTANFDDLGHVLEAILKSIRREKTGSGA